MEYLVESHMGGHYISNSDPEIIEEYCERCGDSDTIILSWEEGKKIETLLDYFSGVKIPYEQLERYKKDSILTKEELIDNLSWAYDEDRFLINELAEINVIASDEQEVLLKQVNIYQKEQFELLKSIYYPNGFVRVKKYNK